MNTTDKLADAVELAEEAIAYVPAFFADKHGMTGRLAALKESLADHEAAAQAAEPAHADWTDVRMELEAAGRDDLSQWVAQKLAAAPAPAQQATQGAEPSPGLLMSMAIRYDHALGLPGYYDSDLFKSSGVTHAQRLESTLRTMRQLWEEATGRGFYSPEREAEYVKLAGASGGEVQG